MTFFCLANAKIQKGCLHLAVRISLPVLTESVSNEAFPFGKQKKRTWKRRACLSGSASTLFYQNLLHKNIEVEINQNFKNERRS